MIDVESIVEELGGHGGCYICSDCLEELGRKHITSIMNKEMKKEFGLLNISFDLSKDSYLTVVKTIPHGASEIVNIFNGDEAKWVYDLLTGNFENGVYDIFTKKEKDIPEIPDMSTDPLQIVNNYYFADKNSRNHDQIKNHMLI